MRGSRLAAAGRRTCGDLIGVRDIPPPPSFGKLRVRMTGWGVARDGSGLFECVEMGVKWGFCAGSGTIAEENRKKPVETIFNPLTIQCERLIVNCGMFSRYPHKHRVFAAGILKSKLVRAGEVTYRSLEWQQGLKGSTFSNATTFLNRTTF